MCLPFFTKNKKKKMSSYLQVATETADLIERGEVQEGSKTNHSDFERLLGITEVKKKQLRQLEQKRIQALEELEEGRKARLELREQMQRSRNEKIIAELQEKKEAARQKQTEQSLRDRLAAALATNQHHPNDNSGDNQNHHQFSSPIKFSSDPFLRFRAEDERIKHDRERVLELKAKSGGAGKIGSDLLRRYMEVGFDFSSSATTSPIPNSSNSPAPLLQNDISAVSNNSNSNSSTSDSSVLRVPTVAALVSEGYGKGKAKSIAQHAVVQNQKVEKEFKQLDHLDQHDINEWKHRRNFYDRERITVLEQMREEGFFRKKFTDDAAPKIQANAILGHKPEADRPERQKHPIDHYHEAVRNAVAELHTASDSWKVVTANQISEMSTLERAAMMTKTSSNNRSTTATSVHGAKRI
jgi:hypothetical protein